MTKDKATSYSYRTADENKRLDMLLVQLGNAERLRKRHAQVAADTVAMLRAEDLDGSCLGSWEAIASQLGITRQAAQQRFNRLGIK